MTNHEDQKAVQPEAMDKGGVLDIKSSESDHDLYIEFRNPAQTSAVRNPDLLFMPFAEGVFE